MAGYVIHRAGAGVQRSCRNVVTRLSPSDRPGLLVRSPPCLRVPLHDAPASIRRVHHGRSSRWPPLTRSPWRSHVTQVLMTGVRSRARDGEAGFFLTSWVSPLGRGPTGGQNGLARPFRTIAAASLPPAGPGLVRNDPRTCGVPIAATTGGHSGARGQSHAGVFRGVLAAEQVGHSDHGLITNAQVSGGISTY